MQKCDACKTGTAVGYRGLCRKCIKSRDNFRGIYFDWCVARHAELKGKQQATDADLIAQAILSGSSLVALAALSYADAVGNEDESTKALRAALKSRGVIK